MLLFFYQLTVIPFCSNNETQSEYTLTDNRQVVNDVYEKKKNDFHLKEKKRLDMFRLNDIMKRLDI